MIELAFDSGFHRFEWIHRKLNGELFPVEVSLTRIELRGEVVLYTLWKDLTDQKRNEQHLHNVIEKLEKASQA